tara:strand:+ start:638 stop:1483 length:846 start_codon:yes stop_codon:yes gene_type:complete
MPPENEGSETASETVLGKTSEEQATAIFGETTPNHGTDDVIEEKVEEKVEEKAEDTADEGTEEGDEAKASELTDEQKEAAAVEEAEKLSAMTSQEKAEYFKEKAEAEAAAEKAKEGKKDGEEGEGAPEEYGDFATPEGFEAVDTEALERFKPVAQDLNLNQDQAQKLVDMFADERTKMIDTQVKQWEDTRAGWLKTSKDDPDIGGKNFDVKVGAAITALDTFGTPALREALEQSGMGSHPEVIRVFANIGEATSEGKIIAGGGSQIAPDKTQAQVMFPNMK